MPVVTVNAVTFPLIVALRPMLPGLHGFNWAILPLALVAGFLLLRVYRADAGRLSAGRRSVLWLLRAGVTALVLVMLLEPSVLVVTHEEKPPVVAILLDDSMSMNYPEAKGQALVAEKGTSERTRFGAAVEALDRLQRELSTTHRVKVFTFSDTLALARDVPKRTADEPPLAREQLLEALATPSGGYTEAGDAVAGVLDRLAGEKVSSVILLSDGRNTGGSDLAQAGESALAGGVPVQTLTFGSEDPLCDLRIDRVDAPAEASLGDLLSVHLAVTNYVRPDLVVEVRLIENDRLDQKKTVTLKKGANSLTLTTIPRTEGLRRFAVELPAFEGESDVANNRAEFYVKVVKRTLRVLFVAGKPTREYQHVTLTMLRDPVIRVSCFLQSAQVDYVQQGNVVIDRLPKTVADWQEYDVVILYDVEAKELSSAQVSGIENTVTKGAGLLLIAGRNHGLAPLLAVHANKMRQMLPVEIDKNRLPRHDRVFAEAFAVERTPEARSHAVFRLVASDRLNETIWSSFPEMYWHHPVVRVKPTAVATLRRTGGPATFGDYGDCLMAIQRFGEGSVIYLGTDEIWRWRRPFGTHDYDLFWTHLVRYLGETRLLGAQKQVALSTDKPHYAPGEKVRIKLSVLDHALWRQLGNERLSVTVIDPQDARQVLPLTRAPEGEAAWVGTYPSRRVGAHRVEATHTLSTADTEAKSLYSVHEAFNVALVPLEAIDTRADIEGMRTLAEKTGGESLDHRTMTSETVAQLAASIPAEPLRVANEIVRDVWDTWVALAVILVLVAAEWSLRKAWGLL